MNVVGAFYFFLTLWRLVCGTTEKVAARRKHKSLPSMRSELLCTVLVARAADERMFFCLVADRPIGGAPRIFNSRGTCLARGASEQIAA